MKECPVVAVDLPVLFTHQGEYVELCSFELGGLTFKGCAPVVAFLEVVEGMGAGPLTGAGRLEWLEASSLRSAMPLEAQELERLLGEDVRTLLED